MNDTRATHRSYANPDNPTYIGGSDGSCYEQLALQAIGVAVWCTACVLAPVLRHMLPTRNNIINPPQNGCQVSLRSSPHRLLC